MSILKPAAALAGFLCVDLAEGSPFKKKNTLRQKRTPKKWRGKNDVRSGSTVYIFFGLRSRFAARIAAASAATKQPNAC
jgi:hypothetical protein